MQSQTRISKIHLNIIFDLDGTLIDSAPTILKGLERVVDLFGINPLLPLTQSLIGPPLKETIQSLIGNDSAYDIEDLVTEFKSYYDEEGYKATRVYDGISELLKGLVESNCALYLATNKRFLPTQKIINHLGWANYFKHVYAIDKYSDKPFSDKTAMIACLLEEQKIHQNASIYVGDRREDWEAATANSLPTILVNWGYGDFEDLEIRTSLAISAHDLLSKIASYQ